MDADHTEEEMYLYERIRLLQDAYQAAIDPFAKRLVALESLRPPRHIIPIEWLEGTTLDTNVLDSL